MTARMEAREINARIAAAYDAMPYDTLADDNLDPERVLGLGASTVPRHTRAMCWISVAAPAPNSHVRGFRFGAGSLALTCPRKPAAALATSCVASKTGPKLSKRIFSTLQPIVSVPSI